MLNKKDFSEAIKSFESVLEIDGNYIRAYSNLGKCYFELGNLGKAKKIFANGLKINSSYQPILRNLVDLHLILQNFEEPKKL